MPRKKQPKPFRNVPKQINEELLKRMSMRHSTMKEMAECLGCHVDTLRDRFSNDIKRWQAEGKLDVREIQWQIMKKGSADMAKWLGRAILKQNEQVDLSEAEQSKLLEYANAIAEARRSLDQTGSTTGSPLPPSDTGKPALPSPEASSRQTDV